MLETRINLLKEELKIMSSMNQAQIPGEVLLRLVEDAHKHKHTSKLTIQTDQSPNKSIKTGKLVTNASNKTAIEGQQSPLVVESEPSENGKQSKREEEKETGMVPSAVERVNKQVELALPLPGEVNSQAQTSQAVEGIENTPAKNRLSTARNSVDSRKMNIDGYDQSLRVQIQDRV